MSTMWAFIVVAILILVMATLACFNEASIVPFFLAAPFFAGALWAAHLSYNGSVSAAKAEFHNAGASQVVTALSVKYDSGAWGDNEYDVTFITAGKLYHAFFEGPISINPSLKEPQATIQHQTNQDGDSRYTITNIQEPQPKH